MTRVLFVGVALLLSACQTTFDEPIRTRLDRLERIQDVDFGTTDGVLNESPYERIHFTSGLPEGSNSGSHDYLLFSFEMDDQGSLFLPSQIDTVHDMILAEAGGRGALIVAFVHGWKHNATPCDANLACFRKVLRYLAFQENLYAGNPEEARRVIGVYVGWRGLSACREPRKLLSFWERKRTAHQVGQSQAREVLQMLREVHENLNDPAAHLPQIQEAVSAQAQASSSLMEELSSISPADVQVPTSHLVVVGHSFGAALVYSSVETDLKQQLSEAARLARLNSSSTLKEIEGFGDLVVLVNPAFEAELFREFPKRLDELQRQRKSFARNQRPVLLVVSSAGDGANHWLFPLGQGLNLLAQPLRIIRGPVAWYNHVVTVGNHLRFRTHAAKPILQLSSSEDQGKSEDNCFQGSLPCNYASCGCSRRFAEAFTADLPVGNDIFGNVRLTETGRLGVKHNPFWVIKADRGVVADHGDIFNPTFVSFLSELVARYASPEAEGEAVEGGSK